MNFYAHLTIATEIGEPPGVGLGAMLPDLTRMARMHVPAELPPDIAYGVWVHHRTDEAFHGHRDFVAGSIRLKDELRRRAGDGLGPGAQRAIAHVGWELLLDGVLAFDSDTEMWERAWDEAARVVPAPSELPRWVELAAHLSAPRWPSNYTEPAWIADRLVHILGARPRLAFAASRVGDVAAALAAVRPSVEAAAPVVMADVLTTMAAARSSGNGP